jgi:hypothetical protein
LDSWMTTKAREKVSEWHPYILGSTGTACAVGIEMVNPWLGAVCAVLTIIYLIQQISNNRKKK